MRARTPDLQGEVVRDGVRIGYDGYNESGADDGRPWIVLFTSALPPLAAHRRDYAEATDPELLAEAIVTELARPVAYRPVETDGADRAARLLAELL